MIEYINADENKGFLTNDNIALMNCKFKNFYYVCEESKNIPESIKNYIDIFQYIDNIKGFKAFLRNKDILVFNDFCCCYKKIITDLKNLVAIYDINNKNLLVVLSLDILKDIFKNFKINEIESIGIYGNKKNNCFPVKLRVFKNPIKLNYSDESQLNFAEYYNKKLEYWFVVAPCVSDNIKEVLEDEI